MTSAKRFLPSFTLFSAFFFLFPHTIWRNLRELGGECADIPASNLQSLTDDAPRTRQHEGIRGVFVSYCVAYVGSDEPLDSLTASEGENIFVRSPDVIIAFAR